MSKKRIIEYLEDKGTYSTAYDFQIDLLIDQIQLYKLARKAIKEEGISVPGNAEGTFMVRNQQLKTLSEVILNIKVLSKALGLSVSDSLIFKQLNGEVEHDDGFNDLDQQ